MEQYGFFWSILRRGGAFRGKQNQLLRDLDDAPETITIEINLFSAYVIIYQAEEGFSRNERDKGETDTKKGNAACGLYNNCLTYSGICRFVWLAALLLSVAFTVLFIRQKKRKNAPEGDGSG